MVSARQLSLEGRHRAIDQVAHHRLGKGGYPRQRHRAGLDPHATHGSAAIRPGPCRTDLGPYAAGQMGRWSEPENLTSLPMFLCTPLSGFMSGTGVPVDGGYAIA